ncbi:hypothetical protein NBH00_06590 [Paraconexibacter antarcticus]|uniref:Uncharacterized protein n=1 Tax=Paraconexibacter antarcticus TaxID=2949664 RepID=A0ABY5DX45_9ACTN|nr:hypothetical protein [Paraconexibacter antarcticus]UTI65878.1 hypothetical protein NBH00_06590 [Paraconexibacter antarcticus]
MARRISEFPSDDGTKSQRRYPWDEWTDGGAWEIRRGEDYDAATENMRVNLHMKADALAIKVRTKKVSDDNGEGLAFQFYDPEENEIKMKTATIGTTEGQAALEMLYADAMEIYERARKEVTIERSDGRTQKYAAVRYKQQIEKGQADGVLVPTIARIIRKPTLGFGHLENANRPDLMLETLVLDTTKPYHRFFTEKTIATARARMQDAGFLPAD